MITRIRKAALASALAAMTLGAAAPAMAQGYPYGDNGGYRNRDRGDSTGAAPVVRLSTSVQFGANWSPNTSTRQRNSDTSRPLFAARVRTHFHLGPVLGPIAAPGHGPAADQARLAGQAGFVALEAGQRDCASCGRTF